MSALGYFRSLADRFLRRGQTEQEMEEELRMHLEQRANDLERSGLDRREAERRARLEFGGYDRFKEECRESFAGNFLETMLQDLRYSLRLLRKSPGFTLVAIGTLTLGIGANAVVFGVLNGLILRPLSVPEPQSLYMIEREKANGSASYPDYIDLRDRNRSFDGLAAFNFDQAGLDLGTGSSRVWLCDVSGNYFDVLRIQPALTALPTWC